MEEMDNLKIYSLMPEEVETLLAQWYGGKIQPVNGAMLESQKQKQRRAQASLGSTKPKESDSD